MRKYRWTLVLLAVGSMAASMLWLEKSTPKLHRSAMAPPVAVPAGLIDGELPTSDLPTPMVVPTLPSPVNAKTKTNGEPETGEGERVQRNFEQPNGQCPDCPQRTRLDEAYAKMRKGMLESEMTAALKAYDITWDPVVEDNYSYFGKMTRRAAWKSKYAIDDGHGQVVWTMQLQIYFADGQLYSADRLDECTRMTRWDSLWSPWDTVKK